jgi:hypothetical protein
MTTYTTEIKRVVRENYEQSHANKLGNIDKLDIP